MTSPRTVVLEPWHTAELARIVFDAVRGGIHDPGKVALLLRLKADALERDGEFDALTDLAVLALSALMSASASGRLKDPNGSPFGKVLAFEATAYALGHHRLVLANPPDRKAV